MAILPLFFLVIAEPAPSAVEFWGCERWGRSEVLLLTFRVSSIDEQLLDEQLLVELFDESESWDNVDAHGWVACGFSKS